LKPVGAPPAKKLQDVRLTGMLRVSVESRTENVLAQYHFMAALALLQHLQRDRG
jgi:hypothetical protein